MTTGEEGRPPVRVGPGVIGLGTAFIAAYGILLAVIMREKSGRGQQVDAAFFDTAVFFLNSFITGYSLTGLSMPRMGSGNAAFVPYQCFETADKPVFIGVTQNAFWKGFCRAAGMEALENDPRFDSNDKRLAHRKALLAILVPAIREFKSGALLARLEAEGVPCAPVQQIPEVIEDPHVRVRQMLYQLEYPGLGKLTVPHIPLRMSAFKPDEAKRPPLLGEHSVEILLELGYSQEKIDALRRDGIILERPE